jgi:2-(1,2-epoxy-1,2-dihydrophenyl)acetyl-CoA isomerase
MPVSYEVTSGVATITLNRPDVLNAFDDEMGAEFLESIERAAASDDVRCIIVTGAGRAFSSGEDLAALAEGYEQGRVPPLGRTLTERYNPTVRAIRAAPKPVVAALNGVAAGAGASIALACDFRIASTDAKLVLAFIKVGLVPDTGAVWFLTKMIGSAKTWELAAKGDPISAEDALRLGLVHQVVPPERFAEECKSFAEGLASGPTRGYALTKSLVAAAGEKSLEEQLELEIEAQTEAGRTQDHLEGVQAFLGKRAPKFQGR